MMRSLAFLWLIMVLAAGGYLLVRVGQGLNFHTDLMALLPREDQNPSLQHTNDVVTRALSQRVVIMVGHKDKAAAYAAAKDITHRLVTSSLFDITTSGFDKDRLRQIGTFYYPYRFGLLSDLDHDRLKTGQGQEIAVRALSQVYGVVGLANGPLLHGDPFLLMPSFLTSLPLPLSRLSLDDGMLSVQDEGTTWVMIAGQIKGAPYALDVQKKVSDVFDHAVHSQRAIYPEIQVLHLGAVFFAKAGGEKAMGETSSIGIVSTIGTILLVLVMFRAIRPLVLSLLVIGVGILTALSVSLVIFGELHIGALLFGISLIGVCVDYSLQYCSEVFSPHTSTPQERLMRVLGGITLGTATTVIGYLTLYLAPFPGLHQIALFSAAGLLAAWITVVLWLPLLDCKVITPRQQPMPALAKEFLIFWETSKYHRLRSGLLGLLAVLGLVGILRFHTDDDVRHMQSLSPDLVTEQESIQKLIGTSASNQFFVVQAPDNETALQNEEKLTERLRPLVAEGHLSGFQSPSQYIPSAALQRENWLLQREHLYKPLLAQQTMDLRLATTPAMPNEEGKILTLAEADGSNKSLGFLSTLLLDTSQGEVTHMVALDGVVHPEAVAAAAEGITGIRLVDPAGDFSRLLGKYRSRALTLLLLSALLMTPLLIWRYGLRKGLWIMVPPLLAVILTPPLRSVVGGAFTFFDAMGLVLVLAIGVDYAVFCAETSGERKPVTILAVTMAASTALLSFGLLALSQVMAVSNFGATMTIGILLSFLFAPMAGLTNKKYCLWPLRKIFSLALIFMLCGCTYNSADETLTNATYSGVVHISPDVALIMPRPADLGRSVEATQLVTAHYGDQNFAFEAHISATPDAFLLVGLDLVGRKIMTIHWTQEGIEFDKALWVPSQLRPENVLSDLVLLYWPDHIVRRAIKGSSVKLIVEPHRRTIMSGPKKVWQADYILNSEHDLWSGKLHYRNLAWGYEFNVQSQEINP
jgi:predicted exporter